MINDTQGHAVGDMVLSQTGSILSEVTGDRGIVGRLGGDEFAVFASGFQNSVEMEEFCVSLRENLKKIIFDMEYSVSIGAAKLDGRRISFPDFYYEADRAVYAAKRGGKNRIVFMIRSKKIRSRKRQIRWNRFSHKAMKIHVKTAPYLYGSAWKRGNRRCPYADI